MAGRAARLRALPPSVVALGVVSLFMDVSSEMIHSTLPLFLTQALGLGTVSVGLIEGIAEATASITKLFAGVASDWTRRRKPLVLLGYGLSAATKPLFPLATGLAAVLTARFVDRIGKGIRDAPRDALIADLTPGAARGAAYGLRQSLDTVGAVAGPAAALVLLAVAHADFRFVYAIAVIPAVVSVAILAVGVHEPDATQARERRVPIRRDEIARLGRRYWLVLAFAAVLALARFSEAFLLLRAADVGISRAMVPLVAMVMNVLYAASAYPLGDVSDRHRRAVLAAGIAFLCMADAVLAAASGPALVMAGAGLWGVHLGATQGVLNAVVADAAPADLRGTGFGLFNLVTGGALLAASLLAGVLWAAVGPRMTFVVGAGCGIVALAGLAAAASRTPGRR